MLSWFGWSGRGGGVGLRRILVVLHGDAALGAVHADLARQGRIVEVQEDQRAGAGDVEGRRVAELEAFRGDLEDLTGVLGDPGAGGVDLFERRDFGEEALRSELRATVVHW